MDTNKYLEQVLSDQRLSDDSKDLKELQTHRADVEEILCASFGSHPIIRYGGSKAKGTLIKESYDLDIVCYLPSDSEAAGETLAEIYTNVGNSLRKNTMSKKRPRPFVSRACLPRTTCAIFISTWFPAVLPTTPNQTASSIKNRLRSAA